MQGGSVSAPTLRTWVCQHSANCHAHALACPHSGSCAYRAPAGAVDAVKCNKRSKECRVCAQLLLIDFLVNLKQYLVGVVWGRGGMQGGVDTEG